MERFDDSSLATEWELHRNQFEIKDGVLWLNGNSEAADTSSIRRLYTPAETMQWTFDVYLNTNPSTKNRVVIYPAYSDYCTQYVYLVIGGRNNADLFLYRNGKKKLIDAERELPYPDGFPCVLSIKLTYEAGLWTLYSSFDKENYTKEGSAEYEMDNPEGEDVYFHLQMEYTKTRNQDFGFDNLVDGFLSCVNLNIGKVGEEVFQLVISCFVGYYYGRRIELPCLFGKLFDLVVGRKAVHFVQVGVLFYNVKCLRSN